jgi:hypothetical protein
MAFFMFRGELKSIFFAFGYEFNLSTMYGIMHVNIVPALAGVMKN